MTDMKVKITSNPAPAHWGDKALVSLTGNDITIHIRDDADRLRKKKSSA